MDDDALRRFREETLQDTSDFCRKETGTLKVYQWQLGTEGVFRKSYEGKLK